ncbi:hypothetical protein L209DRAFT_302958 [Thermothelomyces heterothallicus CBS 203.75]
MYQVVRNLAQSAAAFHLRASPIRIPFVRPTSHSITEVDEDCATPGERKKKTRKKNKRSLLHLLMNPHGDTGGENATANNRQPAQLPKKKRIFRDGKLVQDTLCPELDPHGPHRDAPAFLGSQPPRPLCLHFDRRTRFEGKETHESGPLIMGCVPKQLAFPPEDR